MFTEHLPGGSAWGRHRDQSDMVLALMMGLIPELPELFQIEIAGLLRIALPKNIEK